MAGLSLKKLISLHTYCALQILSSNIYHTNPLYLYQQTISFYNKKRVASTSPSPKTGSVSSVTTLPSGLTIVTENASLTSTLALTYPNAGSSNEHPTEGGAALANRYLSFKSGSGLSSALIIRSLEDVGATLFSSAGRRGATIGFTSVKENAAFVAPLLVTECSFEKWDVKEAQQLAGVEAAEATSNAQVRYYFSCK